VTADNRQVSVFLSYAHEDRAWSDRLLDHLGGLIHGEMIRVFRDDQIEPGEDFDERIKAELDRADIVIAMISPSYFGSPYCTVVELRDALSAKRRVVPVLLGDVDFEALAISRRNALPKDAHNNLLPVVRFPEAEQDEALAQVARQLRLLVESVRRKPVPRESNGGLPATAGLVGIRLHYGGKFYAFDAPFEVFVDGKLLGSGTLKKGFDVRTEVNAGTHAIEVRDATKIAKTLGQKERPMPVTVPSVEKCAIELDVDRMLGNWSIVAIV
jgi:TIR domain-containing protein